MQIILYCIKVLAQLVVLASIASEPDPAEYQRSKGEAPYTA